MSSLAHKAPSEMTAAELQQRLFELNGIQPPEKDATEQERYDYFKACLLTTGMKIYSEKDKAQQFMEETWTAWTTR